MKSNKISACLVIENFIISQRTLRDSLRPLREIKELLWII